MYIEHAYIVHLICLYVYIYYYIINTIKPYYLAKKLIRLNFSEKLGICIINFLCHRKQFVRLKGVLSGERSISTGILQGCVLSPVLFTLYTNDCTGTKNTIFIKYPDGTVTVDLSNSISHQIAAVERFTTWCKDNFFFFFQKSAASRV